MHIVAITGSIGCGKTTLAELIREGGFVVYDVDRWCRALYRDRAFLSQIQEHFPQTFENGCFNKRLLRQIVFSDRNQLHCLEALTHPFLKRRFFKTIRQHALKSSEIIFIDIALLFELGLEKYCTYIILADTDYETQKRRVMSRDHVTEAEVEKIIRCQINNAQKKVLSDLIVDTNRPKGILKAALLQVIGELINGQGNSI